MTTEPISAIHVTVAGAIAALLVGAAVCSVLYWMLTPPASQVQKLAKKAEKSLVEMVDRIMVVFSQEIDSAHMMALAVRRPAGAGFWCTLGTSGIWSATASTHSIWRSGGRSIPGWRRWTCAMSGR